MIKFKDGWRITGRKTAKRVLRQEPYDPDAVDGDNDGIVQEGTPWERPIGTRFIRANGKPIPAGLETANRPSSAKLVDFDGKPVDYTPTYDRPDHKPLGTTIGETSGSIIKPNAAHASPQYSPARIFADDPDEIHAKWEDRIEEIAEEVKNFDERDGDLALLDIYSAQGFDGLPEVIPADQWEDFLEKNKDHQAVHRGVEGQGGSSAAELVEQFRSGDYWPGTGVYGNGTYTTTSRDEAGTYADEGGLIEMAIRPGAKMITLTEADEIGIRFRKAFQYKLTGPTQSYFSVLADPGRLAAIAGYDVMRIDGRILSNSTMEGDYYIVLNRTAVVVKGAK
jgi:hypothetical protein